MTTIQACPPIQRAKIDALTVGITDGDQSLEVSFVNEGTGFYAVLKPDVDDGLRLDPDEAVALGEWIRDICKGLDQQSTHLGERP